MSMRGSLRTINSAINRANQYQKSIEKERIRINSENEVQIYKDYIETLISLHKNHLNTIDWHSLLNIPAPQEPKRQKINEDVARNKLTSYKPNIFDRLFKNIDKRKNNLLAKVNDAKQEDDSIYQKEMEIYEKDYKEWSYENMIVKNVIAGKVEGYEEAIKLVNPFSKISELGSSIEIQFENNKLAEVKLFTHDKQIIPQESKTLLKSGNISIKPLPITKQNGLYQDYVCSSALRVARDLFALLPIDWVLISAISEILNTQTGHLENQPILSVLIPRDTLFKIDFDFIDPSDSINNFIHNMEYSRIKGLQPVSMINKENFELELETKPH